MSPERGIEPGKQHHRSQLQLGENSDNCEYMKYGKEGLAIGEDAKLLRPLERLGSWNWVKAETHMFTAHSCRCLVYTELKQIEPSFLRLKVQKSCEGYEALEVVVEVLKSNEVQIRVARAL